MSYILDALKRAEAERERGSVPGLHAQQVASYDDLGPPTSPLWLWLIAAGILVLLASGAGFWWWRTPAQSADHSASTPRAIAQAAAPDASMAMVGIPTAQAPVRPPKVTGKTLPPSAVAMVVAPRPTPKVLPHAAPVSAPVIVPTTVAAITPTPLPPTKLASQTVLPIQATTVNNPVKATASPTSSEVPLLSELPEDLRRQIPPLVIAGAVYSDDPSQRLLLINNRTFGQDSVVAPGVRLEEIQTSSSIFGFQGIRFQLNH